MDNTTWQELVANAQKAMSDIDAAISALIDSGETSEEACAKLVDVHRLKGDMSIIYDSAASVVADIMKDLAEVSLDNGMRIEKKTASARKTWQHKDLASVVSKRIVESSMDMETGEVVVTPEQMIQNMLVYVQPSYWRVKELSAIGINADQYCEVDEPKTSIIVRKGTSNG